MRLRSALVFVFAYTIGSGASAQDTDDLTVFYDLLFAQGCEKHPDFVPGRNKHWLSEAGFKEEDYASYISKLEELGHLERDGEFIVGKIGICA